MLGNMRKQVSTTWPLFLSSLWELSCTQFILHKHLYHQPLSSNQAPSNNTLSNVTCLFPSFGRNKWSWTNVSIFTVTLVFDYCFQLFEQNRITNQPTTGTYPYGLGSGPVCGCPLTAHLEISETSPNIQTVRNMRLPKATPDKSQFGCETASLTVLPVVFALRFLSPSTRIRIGIRIGI